MGVRLPRFRVFLSRPVQAYSGHCVNKFCRSKIQVSFRRDSGVPRMPLPVACTAPHLACMSLFNYGNMFFQCHSCDNAPAGKFLDSSLQPSRPCLLLLLGPFPHVALSCIHSLLTQQAIQPLSIICVNPNPGRTCMRHVTLCEGIKSANFFWLLLFILSFPPPALL